MPERNHPPSSKPRPTLALLDWSHLIENFLGPLGVSLETFRDEFQGSWIFGYMEALRLAGVRPVWFCFSARVAKPWRFTHAPSGASVCVLPAPVLYRAVRHSVLKPWAYTLEKAVGHNVRGVNRLLLAAFKDVAPYLATPLGLLGQELRREGCNVILCQEYEHARFDACVLLVEGGPALNHALVSTALADELFLTLAPKLLGGERPGALTILESPPIPPGKSPKPEPISIHLSTDELFLRYALRPPDLAF